MKSVPDLKQLTVAALDKKNFGVLNTDT